MPLVKTKSRSTNYVLVVTCVVIRKKRGQDPKVLIIKRSSKEIEGPGLWTIPGGRIEPSDWIKIKIPKLMYEIWAGALERGCRRELREEAHITASRLNFLAGEERLFFRKSGKPTVIFGFWTQKANWKKVRLDSNGTTYRWVTLKELNGYKFIGDVKSVILIALKKSAAAQ